MSSVFTILCACKLIKISDVESDSGLQPLCIYQPYLSVQGLRLLFRTIVYNVSYRLLTHNRVVNLNYLSDIMKKALIVIQDFFLMLFLKWPVYLCNEHSLNNVAMDVKLFLLKKTDNPMFFFIITQWFLFN